MWSTACGTVTILRDSCKIRFSDGREREIPFTPLIRAEIKRQMYETFSCGSSSTIESIVLDACGVDLSPNSYLQHVSNTIPLPSYIPVDYQSVIEHGPSPDSFTAAVELHRVVEEAHSADPTDPVPYAHCLHELSSAPSSSNQDASSAPNTLLSLQQIRSLSRRFSVRKISKLPQRDYLDLVSDGILDALFSQIPIVTPDFECTAPCDFLGCSPRCDHPSVSFLLKCGQSVPHVIKYHDLGYVEDVFVRGRSIVRSHDLDTWFVHLLLSLTSVQCDAEYILYDLLNQPKDPYSYTVLFNRRRYNSYVNWAILYVLYAHRFAYHIPPSLASLAFAQCFYRE